jgi:cell wall-associated NlpC family hydrolase
VFEAEVGFMTSTHLRAGGLMVFLLAMSLSVPVARADHENGRVRLASPEEGEAVVQAAWELRKGLGPKPDCSHFVQAVYAQAGFNYEYANSGELYDGIDSFRRVEKPQAGDLVVWQGHIGIVVDPAEHSFYSSVLSGFAIEDYRSPYWLRRGQPRFFRYLVDSVVSRAGVLAQRSAKRDTPTLKQQPVLDDSVRSKHDANSAEATAKEFPAVNTASASESSNARLDVVFVSPAKPSGDDVLAAITRLTDASGERLVRRSSLDSRPSVAVADQFKVTKLHVGDRSGWAELEVKQAASIQYGFADLRATTSTWRAALRREEQGWVLLAPQDRIYIRRELAIQALSDHLAMLSRMPANSQEVRRLVRVLDELLAEKNAYGGGAAGSQ